jgi:hypothetical protein
MESTWPLTAPSSGHDWKMDNPARRTQIARSRARLGHRQDRV